MEDSTITTSVRRSGRTKKPKYVNFKYHYNNCGQNLDHVEHVPINMINMDQSISLFGRDKPSSYMAKLHGIKYYKKFNSQGDGKIEKLYAFESDSDDEIAQKMKKAKTRIMNISKFKDQIVKNSASKTCEDHQDTNKKSKKSLSRISSKEPDENLCPVNRSETKPADDIDADTIIRRRNYDQDKRESSKICPRPLSPFGMSGLSAKEIYEATQLISEEKENALKNALDKLGSYLSIEVDDSSIIFTSNEENTDIPGVIVLKDDNLRPFQEVSTEYLELTLLWGMAQISKKVESRTVTEFLKAGVIVRLEQGQRWSMRALQSRGCVVEINCPF